VKKCYHKNGYSETVRNHSFTCLICKSDFKSWKPYYTHRINAYCKYINKHKDNCNTFDYTVNNVPINKLNRSKSNNNNNNLIKNLIKNLNKNLNKNLDELCDIIDNIDNINKSGDDICDINLFNNLDNICNNLDNIYDNKKFDDIDIMNNFINNDNILN
jgi:hypothetical protein